MHISPYKIIFENESNESPLCSVCISLYNYQAYIENALDSVKAQTLNLLELIIIEDRSKDSSLKVAEAWLEKHAGSFSRVMLAQHVDNQGLAVARNTGFSLAKTDRIFVLDADNVIYPRCLARLCSSLDNSEAAFTYSIIEIFGERAGITNSDLWNPAWLAKFNPYDAMALIRKSAWEAVGGYSKMQVTGWEDYDFWCKLYEQGCFGVHVPEILCRYRAHSQSMINTVSSLEENTKLLKQEMRERHSWIEH